MSLRHDIKAEVPAIVLCDQNKIVRVLMNLMANSLKYTGTYLTLSLSIERTHEPRQDLIAPANMLAAHGGVTLRVSVPRPQRDPTRCYIRFSVVDTGCGMRDSDVAQACDAFYRCHRQETCHWLFFANISVKRARN